MLPYGRLKWNAGFIADRTSLGSQGRRLQSKSRCQKFARERKVYHRRQTPRSLLTPRPRCLMAPVTNPSSNSRPHAGSDTSSIYHEGKARDERTLRLRCRHRIPQKDQLLLAPMLCLLQGTGDVAIQLPISDLFAIHLISPDATSAIVASTRSTPSRPKF